MAQPFIGTWGRVDLLIPLILLAAANSLLAKLFNQYPGDSQQISQQLFVDFKRALIFGQVAAIVAKGENAPFGGWQFEGMGQALEDQIAILGAKSVEA